jgi:hypothetical protein
MDEEQRAQLLERMAGARTPEEARSALAEARTWVSAHPGDLEVQSEAEMLRRLATVTS